MRFANAVRAAAFAGVVLGGMADLSREYAERKKALAILYKNQRQALRYDPYWPSMSSREKRQRLDVLKWELKAREARLVEEIDERREQILSEERDDEDETREN